MHQKGLAPVLIVLILAGLTLLVGGGYYLGTRQAETFQERLSRQNPVISPSINDETVYTESDPSANWKIYTNENYSLEYPQDATIEITQAYSFITGRVINKLMITPPEEAPNHYIFNVTVEDNTQNLSTRKVVDDYLTRLTNNKNGPGMKGTAERINQTIKPYMNNNIDGLIGIYGYETEFTELVEAKNNKIYSFSIHDGNGYTNDYVSKLFDQILSTFKFLE